MTAIIDPEKYTKTVDLLRSFFLSKGFLEVHTQNRLSILAACEDPETVATFEYNGQKWPLPQTGQMWLEYELLKAGPDANGFFCLSTSYRAEPEPIEGRHEVIFPMFEFEMPGEVDELQAMEEELCEYLGLKIPKENIKSYHDWQKTFNVKELTNDHEAQIKRGMITDFPEFTSPFWNMERDGNTSRKIDVILNGMETIGSAERSCDKYTMRRTFSTISDRKYSQLLYALFGQERVEKELEEFLDFDFFPRSGGGIGVQRMMNALLNANVI
mgnify:CR=1 FL=1|tara:strand:- start:823 stop:1635 length:813 start_codon:yes stop_codon:yes gene_type:complete